MLRKCFCVFALMFIGVADLKADDGPAWLRQAAAVDLPPYSKEIPFVVLHDEQRVKVDESGRIERTNTYAIKVLVKEGRDNARAQGIYITDTDKITEFRAWLIQPNGDVKKYGKSETIDAAITANDVYNDVRTKLISASADAGAGSVFGYEITSQERSIFGQFEHFFQGYAPVLSSRLILTLPAMWTSESKTFNHPEIKPVTEGNSSIWELKGLPFIEPEPLSPSITNIVPRLAVSFFPPAGQTSINQSFKSWSEVSKWIAQLHDPQATVNQAVIDKARELTSGAKSELEKIAAIARFTQGINYVSIQMGTGRGGGYKPHVAEEILKKAYGDCKDKTNLMRALLNALGITAYPVGVYSGDRYYVRKEWPSPQQFNHCIIAIKLNEPIEMPAIVQQDGFGRLLLFDPTDRYTGLGDIPMHEQGSLALIVARESGDLIRMPASPSDDNCLERTLDVRLLADGSINTQIHEEMRGGQAAGARAEIDALLGDSYKQMIEEWISRTVTGAKVDKIESQSTTANGHALLDVSFAATRYAQLMQNKLLIFNPVVVARRDSVVLTKSDRKLPVVLESRAFTETVKVKIPAEFVIDEMPEKTVLETSFGVYQAESSSGSEGILFRRSLTLHNAVIPPEQYEQVKAFFLSIRDSEQSPIVMMRK